MGGQGGHASSSEIASAVDARRHAPRVRGPTRPEPIILPKKIVVPLDEWVDIVERLHKPPKSEKARALEQEAKDAAKPPKRKKVKSPAEVMAKLNAGWQKSERELESEARRRERLLSGRDGGGRGGGSFGFGGGSSGGGGRGGAAESRRQKAMKFGYDAHTSEFEDDFYADGGGFRGGSTRDSAGGTAGGTAGGSSSARAERTLRNTTGGQRQLSESAMRRMASLDKEAAARAKRGPSPSDMPYGYKPPAKGDKSDGGSELDGTAEEILAVCPLGSRAGDELVVALPDGGGLVLTRVPAGVAPGEEFLVRARLGPLPEGSSRSQRLIELMERLLGGGKCGGEEMRAKLGGQLRDLIELLREAAGDRTKAVAVEQLLLDMFGEGARGTDGDTSESESESESSEEEEEEEEEEEDDDNDDNDDNDQDEEERQEEESEEESEEEEEYQTTDDFSEGAMAIEVTCPPGIQPGETLEVRVPKRAGVGEW